MNILNFEFELILLTLDEVILDNKCPQRAKAGDLGGRAVKVVSAVVKVVGAVVKVVGAVVKVVCTIGVVNLCHLKLIAVYHHGPDQKQLV